jgi:hypothetical protein
MSGLICFSGRNGSAATYDRRFGSASADKGKSPNFFSISFICNKPSSGPMNGRIDATPLTSVAPGNYS